MSKSYGKYKTQGICYGDNTEYYRDRRKHQRRVNNHRIRNVIANNNIDDFDDNYQELTIPKKDSWDEPTDGTYRLHARDVKELKEKSRTPSGVYITKDNKIKK